MEEGRRESRREDTVGYRKSTVPLTPYYSLKEVKLSQKYVFYCFSRYSHTVRIYFVDCVYTAKFLQKDHA